MENLAFGLRSIFFFDVLFAVVLLDETSEENAVAALEVDNMEVPDDDVDDVIALAEYFG